MQIGMIGLGRMGANMVRRLARAGHACVAFDRNPAASSDLDGARKAQSLAALVAELSPPRAIWMMVPAAAVEATLAELSPLLEAGDAVIDGGNSHYHDAIRRAEWLGTRGIDFVDVGTSGGVKGLERGYCLMIGGNEDVVRRLDPIFASLAPGYDAAPPTPGRAFGTGTAERGYLRCGGPGAGHFVKMVHNGIEYGMMAAFAEGLNLLHHADVGTRERAVDAETTPLRHPEHFLYDIDVAEVTELWRRGSVVSSFLLDVTAEAFRGSPDLTEYEGRVSDSGEGRWTVQAAVDAGVPAPVLTASLYARFSSRGNDLFAGKVLSAMRKMFGGHAETRSES